jgi:hypothetical protein
MNTKENQFFLTRAVLVHRPRENRKVHFSNLTCTKFGRWFTVGSLLLIILGSAGCSTPYYGKIQFQLYTGGDDFRGDNNERLQAQLLGAGGQVLDTINQVNVNGSLTTWIIHPAGTLAFQALPANALTGNPNSLPNYSLYVNTISFTNWVHASDIKSVKLQLFQGDYGFPHTADNWTMGGIEVTLISQANTVPNVNLIGLGRLAPADLDQQPPTYVWRFKVNPDRNEFNSGPTVKIPVPISDPGFDPALSP